MSISLVPLGFPQKVGKLLLKDFTLTFVIKHKINIIFQTIHTITKVTIAYLWSDFQNSKLYRILAMCLIFGESVHHLVIQITINDPNLHCVVSMLVTDDNIFVWWQGERRSVRSIVSLEPMWSFSVNHQILERKCSL